MWQMADLRLVQPDIKGKCSKMCDECRGAKLTSSAALVLLADLNCSVALPWPLTQLLGPQHKYSTHDAIC